MAAASWQLRCDLEYNCCRSALGCIPCSERELRAKRLPPEHVSVSRDPKALRASGIRPLSPVLSSSLQPYHLPGCHGPCSESCVGFSTQSCKMSSAVIVQSANFLWAPSPLPWFLCGHLSGSERLSLKSFLSLPSVLFAPVTLLLPVICRSFWKSRSTVVEGVCLLGILGVFWHLLSVCVQP